MIQYMKIVSFYDGDITMEEGNKKDNGKYKLHTTSIVISEWQEKRLGRMFYVSLWDDLIFLDNYFVLNHIEHKQELSSI